ncbi:apolipoprotein A-I-like [Thalassophryne amazonica]|uniref:apolipoprotein A-I-like n=1 Tax=Thalassophryne amazonica TaxID=390379 RepID=UPI0014719469|nr:apolipoprotein A-I-like [Thalassophryne amazonica]
MHTSLQTTIMKFLALALALLLAVGSQAASMKQKRSADPNLQQLLQDLQTFADSFMKHRIQGIQQIEDTFKDNTAGDNVADNLKVAYANLLPFSNVALNSCLKPMAESADNAIEKLKAKLEANVTKLIDVLEKHFQEYETGFGPIYQGYATACKTSIEQAKTQLAPKQEEMMKKVSENLKETKAALIAIFQIDVTEEKQTYQTSMDTAANNCVQKFKEAVGFPTDDADPEAAKKWLVSTCMALTS